MRADLAGFDVRRLRLCLALFFLALAVPTTLLIRRAYLQAKWEAWHQQQVLAEEFVRRIDTQLAQLVQAEEARSFTDFSFLVVAGDPAANFVQRSVLSAFPVQAGMAGLLGYFQIDAVGRFSSPLLPIDNTQASRFGIGPSEYQARSALSRRLQDILLHNRLVTEPRVAPDAVAETDAPRRAAAAEGKTQGGVREEVRQSAPAAADYSTAQAAFDKLKGQANKLGSVMDSRISEAGRSDQAAAGVLPQTAPDSASAAADRSSRREQNALPEPADTALSKRETTVVAPEHALRITTFASEIDPFELSRLGSGHFVLFRNVWRQGQRYIQGALLEQRSFLQETFYAGYARSALAATSELRIHCAGVALPGAADASDSAEAPVYRGRLSAPFSDFELLFYRSSAVTADAGTALVVWLAAVLLLVLSGGVLLLYRLGARQIALVAQQRDFISAVSHELKTPLTSIRMYGEMLREGWVEEQKKSGYYDYICSESERLSRLINNVLQLAKMSRRDFALVCKPMPLSELLDLLQPKLSAQIAQAGFALAWHGQGSEQVQVEVDPDAVLQIMINLVDNALKFSAAAAVRNIDIDCRVEGLKTVVFGVRDYGPGLPKGQMRKIFRMFYRLENALTRTTAGTGIGLALVQRLVLAMQGSVDVVNAEPGALFRIHLPCRSQA